MARTPNSDDAIAKLIALSDPKRALQSQRYFKTGPGQYGEGDQFLGIQAKALHQLAKHHSVDSLAAIRGYIRSPYHEARLFGLLCLVYRYPKADPAQRQKIYECYVAQFKYINNWDFVDCSAPKIVGAHLRHGQREVLYTWANDRSLWTRRIAMLTTLAFIRDHDFKDALAIAKQLLQDDEDLIHKAVGWMLREIGKRDRHCLDKFLAAHYQKMPRTMLRYAIEKHPPAQRQGYLKGSV